MSTLLDRLRRPLASFRTDRSGATAVVFAVCALPMIGIVGLGTDYAQGLSYKRRLDAANDSAALAAISAAQTYYAANVNTSSDPTLTSNAVAVGQAQGKRAFAMNAGSAVTYVPASPTVLVSRSGQTFTATSTYSGQMKTNFGKLFGTAAFTLGNTASSSVTMGSYLDFYLALDVSGSMGFPTSVADQTKFSAINPDNNSSYPHGCAFACHFSGDKGYTVAHANNIKLRVDSVASAVNNLITTATNTATLTNQYRIGVYPFIDNVMQAAPISTSFTNAQAVANTLGDTYLDQGGSNSATQAMGSGGTHFENVLPPFNNWVTAIGNGATPQTAKPFIFIVTDGADNNQTYSGGQWSSGGSEPREPNNFGYCQYAQQVGVTIAILYIPYVPIQWPVMNEDTVVNSVIPEIPSDLQSCASPGFFFTANTDADINNAMQTMFAQALQASRLTK